MSYKNISPVLRTILDLATDCGLFTRDTELNNGYGCLSASKQKSEPGCCFNFDCPLAYTAGLDDLKQYDSDLYEEYKDEPGSDDECGEWVIQYRECLSTRSPKE